jgi:hypothetical protein
MGFSALNPAPKQTVSAGNLDTMGSEGIFEWKLGYEDVNWM